MTRNKSLWIVLLAVLALRLPFLNQAMQGDDVIYLAGAQHAQVEPLHPSHFEYIFLGKPVDMRGHPHPPFNSWFLGLLLAIFRDIREIPFHAAYILFSWIAGLSMLSIAQRFSPRPLIATLLFLVVPPFVVNGMSLESDLPFLAFWMLAIAAYLAEVLWLSAVAGFLAALCAYQAIVLLPVLFFAPVAGRKGIRHWAAILAPAAAIGGFQLFERLTSDALPATVLSGYLTRFGWQEVEVKLRNGAALAGHFAVTLVSPIAWLLRRRDEVRERWFLWTWIGLFFAFALAIFFAGSARYLLPIAAPLCILVSSSRLAVPAIALQGALALAMAIVNYQHWGGIREFAMNLPLGNARRIFVGDEWGLRYYMESRGARPLEVDQKFRAGDIVVTSAYVEPPPGNRALLQQAEIQSPIPVRIVGLGSKSAYSSVQFGLLPFEFSRVPLDRLRAETVVDFEPTLEAVAIGASPEANRHIVAGISPSDRWTLQQASLILKRPGQGAAAKLRLKFYVPQNGVGRKIEITVDGTIVKATDLDHDGIYEIEAALPASAATKATIGLRTDKPLTAPGDQRQLGVNLLEAGLFAN